jgi:hypothetical protein
VGKWVLRSLRAKRGRACASACEKRGCPARLRPRAGHGGGEKSGRARALTATRAGFSALLLCTGRQSTDRAARGPQRAKTSCGPSTGNPQGTAAAVHNPRPARARAKGRAFAARSSHSAPSSDFGRRSSRVRQQLAASSFAIRSPVSTQTDGVLRSPMDVTGRMQRSTKPQQLLGAGRLFAAPRFVERRGELNPIPP